MPRGNPGQPKSAEHRASLSAAAKSRKLSPETRQKLSAARRGVPKSPEHRANISAALKGKPKTSDINYHIVHSRMGAASAHLCSCGSQALDWAYQYTCREPLFSPEGWPYSTDPSDYLPMCRRCHKKLDAAR